MVLPLVLAGAGLGLSAAGGAAGYFGNRKAAKRKKRAINYARQRNTEIDQGQMAAENTAGQGRDSALLDYLSSMPASQATGAADATTRRAAITTAAGPQGDGLGTSNDGLAATLYAQAMGRDTQARGAEDATQTVSLGQRAQQNALRSSNTRAASTAVPLANARYNAQVQRLQLQQWLEDQLGRTTNSEANLGLMANLLGAGGNAAGTFAGATGTPGGLMSF